MFAEKRVKNTGGGKKMHFQVIVNRLAGASEHCFKNNSVILKGRGSIGNSWAEHTASRVTTCILHNYFPRGDRERKIKSSCVDFPQEWSSSNSKCRGHRKHTLYKLTMANFSLVNLQSDA